MWRIKVVYFHPFVELEDECYLDYDTDILAWRAHEFLFKAHNVLSVSKPFKVL